MSALHGGEVDGAAGKPWALQPGDRIVPDQQTADAGRIAEHLVKRDRDEVRLNFRQVEAVGRHERGRVEENVPPVCMGPTHQVERVLHAGEIGLRGEREEVSGTTVG